jgi:predicted phosphoribosyltransferase/pimeloyl-ACP methyl ester carboxylesterase
MKTKSVTIESAGAQLAGELTVPDRALGLVIFAHGSGSSRRSPRNLHVAAGLAEAGLATLLFDLLTEAEGEGEAAGNRLRFDIGLLTGRLVGVVDWATRQARLRDLPIGLFGASTGAAAALCAAAARPERIAAVVSRGGRPDLAGDALAEVRAPTLLIVGERDPEVLELNLAASRELVDVQLNVVAGASHLFEEPGTLESVARLARGFFLVYLARPVRLPYEDRVAAGRALAERLRAYAGRADVLVLGLPRGGVPVAAQVARGLGAPLDVITVRKLGTPGQPELALGAIAPDGVRVINEDIADVFGAEAVEEEEARQRRELERREGLFRAGRPPLVVRGKLALLVDDGLATGATMRAAAAWARAAGAAQLVVAVPVGSATTVARLASEVDDVVCLATPPHFRAVGQWYRDFGAVSEAEVVAELARARAPLPASA